MNREAVQVDLGDARSYSIRFGSLGELPTHLASTGIRKGSCILVSDINVASLYLKTVRNGLLGSGWGPITGILIPSGESSKSFEELQHIYDDALAAGIDRHTPIFALGGGVIGDLAGFAAATLLRGLPLVHLPTSLIAQVDSSIGGKTGINHHVGKNLIGAFYQPKFVYTDLNTLHSLPELEWGSGLAEVVKHGLIADAKFVDSLSSDWEKILQRDPATISPMILRAAEIKATIVSEDELETSRRAILNFGHTFGHAIERVAGYGKFTHGEAVTLGMRAATKVSQILNPDLPYEKIDSLLKRLPVRNSIGSLDPKTLTQAMYFDKKTQAGSLRLILLRDIGNAYVTDQITEEQVLAGWDLLIDP